MKPIIDNSFTENIVRCEDLEEITSKTATALAESVLDHDWNSVVLPVGRTQYPLYEWAAENRARLQDAVRKLNYIQLDEYLGVKDIHDPNLLFQTLRKRLLDPVDHPLDRRTLFNMEADPAMAAQTMELAIRHIHTRIDLAILGMGANGHIGFNEPGTPFDSPTHVVDLDERTRRQNAKLWGGINNVPLQAITLGLGTLREAYETIVMVSGEEKAEAMEKLLTTRAPTPDLPASYLRFCQGRVTILADRAAMGVYF